MIEYGTLDKKFQQPTFGAHFVEVAVDAFTGETRVRRMLKVCAAGRIVNPRTARSQVIGAMTMGLGAALIEELAVDKRRGSLVNRDLAGYNVPVHADVPHHDVVLLDETDPFSSPMNAKGVGELASVEGPPRFPTRSTIPPAFAFGITHYFGQAHRWTSGAKPAEDFFQKIPASTIARLSRTFPFVSITSPWPTMMRSRIVPPATLPVSFTLSRLPGGRRMASSLWRCRIPI